MTDNDDARFMRGLRRGEPIISSACIDVYRLCSIDDTECLIEAVLKDEGCWADHPEAENCPVMFEVMDKLDVDMLEMLEQVWDPISGRTTIVYIDIAPLVACLQ